MCSVVDGNDCSTEMHGKDYFPPDEWIALKARTDTKLRKICDNHSKRYSTFYSSRFKSCCDPFREKRHSRPMGTLLKTITVQMYLKSRGVLELSSPLVPGQKLCKKCFSDLQNLLKLVEGFDDPPSSASSTAPNSASVSQDLFADENLDDNQEGSFDESRHIGPIQNVGLGDDADRILNEILWTDQVQSQDKSHDASTDADEV